MHDFSLILLRRTYLCAFQEEIRRNRTRRCRPGHLLELCRINKKVFRSCPNTGLPLLLGSRPLKWLSNTSLRIAFKPSLFLTPNIVVNEVDNNCKNKKYAKLEQRPGRWFLTWRWRPDGWTCPPAHPASPGSCSSPPPHPYSPPCTMTCISLHFICVLRFILSVEGL